MSARVIVLALCGTGCALAHELPFDGGPDTGTDAPIARDLGLTASDAPMGWSECAPVMPTETRMPFFLFDLQPFAATVVHAPATECGCTPSIPSIRSTGAVSMQLCGCCNDCDCAQAGYEASVTNVPFPRGTTEISVGGSMRAVVVLGRGMEHPAQVSMLSVVGPDPMNTRSGPPLWWLRVDGTDTLCCAQPMPLVEDMPGANGEIAIRVTSAASDPCTCVGTLVPFTAWHLLGELASGDYHVRGGSMAASFTVP